MLALTAAILIILCFPWCFELYAYYDEGYKKAFFSLKLFGISILSGYIRLAGGIMYIHVSDKKAIALRIVSIKDLFKSNVNYLQSVELLTLKLYLDAPANEKYIIGLGVLSFIKSILLPIYKTNKPFIRIKQRTTVGKSDRLQFYFAIVFAFNLISVITIVFRKLKNIWTIKKA